MGRQIRGRLQPHTLQKSKLTSVEVSGIDPGTWSRVSMKKQVEELLIKHNVEQFLHAGDTPFGYSAMGDELRHAGDTPLANDIYT
jgi:putative transposon-encoded protein